jgi:cell division protein FtsQ
MAITVGGWGLGTVPPQEPLARSAVSVAGRRDSRRGELEAVAAKRRAGPRAPAAAAVSPRAANARALALLRLAPSGRSLVVGFALLAFALGAYAVARETSLFAVDRIDVIGASPAVTAEVRDALASFDGVSLVALDGDELVRRVESVPTVYAAGYDRAFPHTLRIVVRAEHAVAVLRRGHDSWLVSARGRVLQRLRPRTLSELPRIWVPSATQVELGESLATPAAAVAARALEPLVRARFPIGIKTVAFTHGELTFALASHVELRLGRPEDVRLKLAVARHIVTALPGGTAYVDVSVPERPVAGPAQISG